MDTNTKTCTRCKQTKERHEFSAHPKAKDGLQSQCKACFAERARLKRVGRPCASCSKPMDDDSMRSAKICKSCSEVCFECKIRPRQTKHRRCSECQSKIDAARKSGNDAKLAARVTRIASKYKVRRPLAAVLAVSKHCTACGKECTRTGELHVDHCHATGEVRGMLCFNCNAALGHVNDSVERLNMLIAYLNKSSPIKALDDLEKAKHFIELLIELETRPSVKD